MSKKARDKALKAPPGGGGGGKAFHSKFAAGILAKYGWKEFVDAILGFNIIRGQGLGKNQGGIVDAIQLRQNQNNAGLGTVAPCKVDEWHNWWDDLYNTTAANFKSISASEQFTSTGNSTSSTPFKRPTEGPGDSIPDKDDETSSDSNCNCNCNCNSNTDSDSVSESYSNE